MRDRRILATVWSMLCAISVPVTIISGLPTAIATTIKYGPPFLSSPNTWWAVGVAVVWLAVMVWIWRRGGTANPLVNLRLSQMPKWMEGASVRIKMLWLLLDEMTQFSKIVAKTTLTDDDKHYAREMLNHVYRNRIQDLLESDILDRYTNAVEAADKTAPLAVTAQAAVHVVWSAIGPKLEEEGIRVIKEQRELQHTMKTLKAFGISLDRLQ